MGLYSLFELDTRAIARVGSIDYSEDKIIPVLGVDHDLVMADYYKVRISSNSMVGL
jgi:hypothetical protein